MQKILCRLPNWVGDVIMCLPSLKLLAQQQIEPILLGKPWIHALLSGLNLKTYTWPKQKWSAIKLLNQLEPSHMLLFPNSFSSALIAKLAGKSTIGYRADGRRFLLNQAISRPALQHEADVFYYLSTRLCLTQAGHADSPELPLSLTTREATQEVLNFHQIPQHFILLCPFAHGLNHQGLAKTWPEWGRLAQELASLPIVICPGPNEVIEAQNRFPHAKIIPHLPLDQYAAIASQASLVIANDSGPMHLAAAVGAPTLAIFGATDPRRAAPSQVTILGDFGQWPRLEQVLAQIEARF